MLRRVLKYISDNELLEQGKKVLVCVSGGADSVALLDVLLRGGYECVVAHCNFHLRGEESERDERFVRDLCAKRNVPMETRGFDTIESAKEIGKSVEMTARVLRYKWFDEVAKAEKCQAIAVAHHQNDQAETLLMNLKRGAGIRGLCGMRAKSKNPCIDSEIPVVRPLLCTTHEYICHYLKDIRKMDWREDSSNQDVRYRRNEVRQEIKGYAKAEIEHLAETARIMQGYVDWLEGKETKGAAEMKRYEKANQGKRQTFRHFGLIGRPLEHSYSAKYFTQFFQKEGIKADYQLFEREDIGAFIESKEAKKMTGMNVTYPYKIAILPYLSEIDEAAQEIGAVNVIKHTDKGWKGYNTDWLGFTEAIKKAGWKIDKERDKALILGTGGVAKAVEYALKKMGVRCQKVSRDSSKGLNYKDLTKEIMAAYTIVVQCTPLGMKPQKDTFPEIPYAWITKKHKAFDCIYNPVETLFLKQCKQQGAQTKNGLTMLKEQAHAAWEIWNEEDEKK